MLSVEPLSLAKPIQVIGQMLDAISTPPLTETRSGPDFSCTPKPTLLLRSLAEHALRGRRLIYTDGGAKHGAEGTDEALSYGLAGRSARIQMRAVTIPLTIFQTP